MNTLFVYLSPLIQRYCIKHFVIVTDNLFLGRIFYGYKTVETLPLIKCLKFKDGGYPNI